VVELEDQREEEAAEEDLQHPEAAAVEGEVEEAS
jgi:hypothetical protein